MAAPAGEPAFYTADRDLFLRGNGSAMPVRVKAAGDRVTAAQVERHGWQDQVTAVAEPEAAGPDPAVLPTRRRGASRGAGPDPAESAPPADDSGTASPEGDPQ